VRDIQVVKSRQVLTPTSVKGIPGIPNVIEIRGANLHAVTEVRINDSPSPSFAVESARRMVVQLPRGLSATPRIIINEEGERVPLANLELIRTVEVLTSTPVTTEPAKLFFEFGRTPRSVEGIQKLVQLVIKILLTTPGRDIFNPGLGGGFLSHVGKNISVNNSAGLMTDLTVGLSRTQSQIVAGQSADPSIPNDERLLSLDLADAVFDTASLSVFIAIRVQSVAGEEAVSKLFL
jgi:hypothetical protein